MRFHWVSLVAVSIGLGVVVAATACVSDAPLMPDAGGDVGTVDAPTSDVGPQDAGDAGPLPLSCGVVPNSTFLIADLGMEDAGAQKVDTERFSLIRLNDGTTFALATARRVANGTQSEFRVWTFDSTQGTPFVKAITPMLTADRLVKIKRIVDGIGVLVYEQKPNWGFSVYKLTDADAKNGTANLQLSRRVEPSSNTFNGTDAHSLLPIGIDDYFLVGEVHDGMGTAKMLSSRMNVASPPAQEKTVGPFITLPNNMLLVGTDVHHFEALGMFPMLDPGDRVFNAGTAVEQKRTSHPKALCFGAREVNGGYAMAFGEADWATGSGIAGLRVGVAPSLVAIDATKFPLVPLGVNDLPLAAGMVDWFLLGAQPPAFVMAGQSQMQAPGVSFLWIDGNGMLRAKHTQSTRLLTNIPNIAVIAVQPLGTPTQLFARWAFAYAERDMQGRDKIWYSQVQCN